MRDPDTNLRAKEFSLRQRMPMVWNIDKYNATGRTNKA